MAVAAFFQRDPCLDSFNARCEHGAAAVAPQRGFGALTKTLPLIRSDGVPGADQQREGQAAGDARPQEAARGFDHEGGKSGAKGEVYTTDM